MCHTTNAGSINLCNMLQLQIVTAANTFLTPTASAWPSWMLLSVKRYLARRPSDAPKLSWNLLALMLPCSSMGPHESRLADIHMYTSTLTRVSCWTNGYLQNLPVRQSHFADIHMHMSALRRVGCWTVGWLQACLCDRINKKSPPAKHFTLESPRISCGTLLSRIS